MALVRSDDFGYSEDNAHFPDKWFAPSSSNPQQTATELVQFRIFQNSVKGELLKAVKKWDARAEEKRCPVNQFIQLNQSAIVEKLDRKISEVEAASSVSESNLAPPVEVFTFFERQQILSEAANEIIKEVTDTGASIRPNLEYRLTARLDYLVQQHRMSPPNTP